MFSESELKSVLDELVRDSPMDVTIDDEPFKEVEKRYASSNLHRYNLTANLIPRMDGDIKVLDVGIAFGHLAILTRKLLGYRVSGVDIRMLDYLTNRFNSYQIDVKKVDLIREPLPFNDETFDILTYCEVMEDTYVHPIIVLKEINRVLRKGGFLVLTTPNMLSLYSRVNFLFGKNPNSDWAKKAGHFREYTLEEVRFLLEGTGFEIERALLENVWIRSWWMSGGGAKRLGLPIYQLLCKVNPKFRDDILMRARKVQMPPETLAVIDGWP
jgi:ubiquinone/menaquinone biosynthesis C-methylase UbiE